MPFGSLIITECHFHTAASVFSLAVGRHLKNVSSQLKRSKDIKANDKIH